MARLLFPEFFINSCFVLLFVARQEVLLPYAQKLQLSILLTGPGRTGNYLPGIRQW